MNVKKINLSDNAVDLWKYYNPSMPFFVGMIGFSDCLACKDENYYVKRTDSQLLAIEYIRQGSGTLVINGKTYPLSQGSLFFLTKNSDHVYYPDKEDLWVKDWVILDGELAHNMTKWYLPRDEYCIQGFDAEGFFNDLRALTNTHKDNFEIFLRYATLLFCRFMTDVNAYADKQDNSVAARIKRIIDYSSQQNLTVKDIADKLHYSVNYVIRTFKDEYGCTPAQYYLQRKTELAKLFLRTNDETVNEISEKLHFVDQHYFSNAFKRQTGMTPSEYRAKFRIKQ